MPAKKKIQAPSPPAAAPPAPVAGSKLNTLVALLQREDGATLQDMTTATGWQTHSIHGALAGALKKKGHAVTSEKTGAVRVYRLPAAPSEAQP